MFWSRFSNIVSLSIAKGESSEFGLLVNFEQFIFYPTQNLDCLDKGELFQISEFGLLIKLEKSIFYPTQNLEWLEIQRFFFSILVPTRYVNDTVGSL